MNLPKFFSIAVLLIPIILPAEPKEDTNYTFRNTRWGMTKHQVRVSEGKREPILEKENRVAYVDTINAKSFAVFYSFIDNKLTNGGYVLAETHTNANKYIQDYKDMKALLIEKYGEPEDEGIKGDDYEEIVWLNDLYKDDPQDWGIALEVGDLVYQLCFETQETDIMIKLTGEDYEVRLMIKYWSKKLRHLEKKKKEEEVEDKL